jgi:hypothetical protein
MGKILTYSSRYFLSDPNRQNGLLVPIWEQALRAGYDTTDGLDVIRTVGYGHVVRLSVAISFGLLAKTVGRHLWSLTERQAVANHIADCLTLGQPLDIEFLYLPLLMAGTRISEKLQLAGEDGQHTLTLIKKARDARPDLFADQDMAQARKVYNQILQKARQ